MSMGWGATKTLIYDDYDCHHARMPIGKRPRRRPGFAQVVFGNDDRATTIYRTEPQYFDIRSRPVAEGSSFSQWTM